MIPNVAIDAAGNMHNLTRICKVDDKVLIYIYNGCCKAVFILRDNVKKKIWHKCRNNFLVCNTYLYSQSKSNDKMRYTPCPEKNAPPPKYV